MANAYKILGQVADASANDTITLTLGVTLQTGAEISVGASDANVTFQAYGTEIT